MAFDVVEASIAQVRAALESGEVTAVELAQAYLDRIARLDAGPGGLNSVCVLDPTALDQARASDERRARGATLGPLDGICYTAKDSYMVQGLTCAAGSPAFKDLVATRDAFTIERLRKAGAVHLGRTTMPPMANGGMQRGLYGRAESPYDRAYLTSAFGSGSSNGSGTATAASLATFGLGEETWSSGRAPASCNALVAYTPSRGLISVRGNWPLVPTMDVVVPHTRTVADMQELVPHLIAFDPDTRGDLWRMQHWVAMPSPEEMAASRGSMLPDVDLSRVRVAIPRMYINGTPDAPHPIRTRDSVIALWERARTALEAAGAEVMETDLPAVEEYEAGALVQRGWVPAEYFENELWDLSMWGWDDFLAANGQPGLSSLAEADPDLIFPAPAGASPDRYDSPHLPARYADDAFDLGDHVRRAREGVVPWHRVGFLQQGLEGLERARKVLLEDWMDAHGLDAVVLPTMADVGPADSDTDPASADLAWRNGVWVANGNLAIRHLGIPTVTVPMGVMEDTGMPVGLTIMGRAWDDAHLLSLAAAIEKVLPPRVPPSYLGGDA
ncbi:amidase [Demequina capsici]|uniref:Amidase n=1 Tax=Demequina capsici TaxID=3075620 RepID=A0AA96JAS1_9MICO|nr:amidase [Demequina sp. PMTSA13]WNM27283.1 amidase [Demequina sp. PMTSA13]